MISNIIEWSLKNQVLVVVATILGIVAVFTVGPVALHECLYLLQGRSPSADDRFFGVLAWYGFYTLMSLVVCSALWVVRMHGYRFGNFNQAESRREEGAGSLTGG